MTCTLLDGDLFREMLLQSWHHLSEHKKEVDALNVFPFIGSRQSQGKIRPHCGAGFRNSKPWGANGS